MFDQNLTNKISKIVDRVLASKNDLNSNKRLNRWMLPILYTLVKDQNQFLAPGKYKEYTKKIDEIFKENKFTKLGSFNSNVSEFMNIHTARSNKVQNRPKNDSRNGDDVFIDASKLIVYNPKNDTISLPFITQDNKATYGISVKMPAKYQDWLVRFEPDDVFRSLYNNVDFKVRLKVEKNGLIGNEGMAVGVGAYNHQTKERPLDMYIYLNEMKEDYIEIDCGRISYPANTVFYIFPIINPNIKSIYLDGFIFKK